MKRIVLMVSLSLSLLLGGCTSTPVEEGFNADKAAQANAQLGLRYMMEGQYEVAMTKLKRALSYDSDDVNANHYIAELYRRLGRNDDAEEHYEHALRYAEGEASALHNNYGVFLCSEDRYDDGIEQLEKVLDNPVYPQRDQVYENIGLCTERKGDTEKAEDYLRKGLQLNPRMPKSLLAMARLTFAKKNYLSTRAYLQRFGELARHTPESLWIGIQVERILGDKNALASYELSLKGNFPDAPETKLYMQSK